NVYDSKVYNVCTRLYLQHRGNIGSVLFSQELLYEQFNFTNNTMSTTTASGTITSRRPAEGRIGIGIGLGKYVKAGSNHIAVFASYRPYIQFDFKNDDASYYKDRFIDYTNLRIDAGYLIANQLYIGIYGERDTNFSYVTSADPYRLNSITPILGLVCNYLIFAGADKEKLGTKAFKYFYTK
ncbi:MAG: hypothetical protein H7259_00075, partial [Cytophagales bacterium]|nr:hypothetical protein [Cytophaga sp.]